MAKYQAYAEYKDSGVEWLGQIPKTWDISRLKYTADIFGRIGFRGYTVDDIVDEGEGALVLSPSNILGDQFSLEKKTYLSWKKYYESPEIMVELNDILLVKTGSTYGKSTIILEKKEPMTINPQMALLKKIKLEPRFLYYLFQSTLYKAIIDISNTGSGMPTMTQENINSFPIPSPDFNEALNIANFLDHETGKIDHLIEKQQQLIELLKEKRQAVISHAVTKGLDPHVPMKDSGVEWLGEVPEHWEIIKFDYVINSVGDIDHYMPNSVDSGIPYVMTGDLQDLVSKIDFESCKQVAYSDYIKLSRKIKTSKDDIILARYATIGTISYVDIDAEFLVSYSCVTIKPNIKRTSGRYLFCYLKSQAFLQAIKMHINSNTQGNVGVDSLRNVKIVVPPLSEQNEIIHFLNEEVVKVDKLINKAESAISLMQERRTALISAAVTGKIDVRNWQAPSVTEAHTELSA